MNISPIMFAELIFTTVALAVAVIIVVAYFSKLVKKYHELGQLTSEINKQQSNVLDQARNKAIGIIDDANNKSLDIVQKANLFTNSAQNNFDTQLKNFTSMQIKAFEQSTSEFINLYSNVLNDLKSKNIEVLQSVSKDIEVNATDEIKSFKEAMQKLTTLSQKEVRAKIDADYEASKKEIENYKKEELQKIDSGIYELLEKMTKLVLGKALSLSEHEKLIEESLEKAKKEGVFKA